MTDIQDLIKKLSEIKSFQGSIPDRYSKTTYMKTQDIEKELRRRYEQFLKLDSLRGCGELTKNERKEFTLMKLYFNGGTK